MAEEARTPTRWARWRRRLTRAAWVSALLLLGLYLSREWTVHPALVRLAGPLGRLGGVELEVQDLDGSWFGGLAVEGLTARPLEGEGWSAEVATAAARWDLGQLVRGRADWLTAVEVKTARVDLRPGPQDADSSSKGWPSAPTWLPRLDARDVSVVVHRPDGSRLEVLGLEAFGRRAASDAWSLELRSAFGRVADAGTFEVDVAADLVYANGWVDLERVDVEGEPWIGPSRVDLGRLADGELEVELTAGGPSEATEVRLVLDDGRVRADVEVAALDLGEIEDWWPGLLTEPVAGGVNLYLQLDGPLADPLSGTGSVRLDVGGLALRDRELDDLLVRGSMADGLVTLERLEASTPGTDLRASGLSISLAEGLVLPGPEDLEGDLSVRTSELDRWIRGPHVARAPAHELVFEGRCLEGSFVIDTGLLTLPGGEVAVDSGAIDLVDGAHQVELEGRLDLTDLAEFGALLGDTPWAGRLAGALTADGPLEVPRVTCTLAGEGLRIGPVDLGTVALEARSTQERAEVEAFSFEGPEGSGSLTGAFVYDTRRLEGVRAALALTARERWGPWLEPGGRFDLEADLDGPLETLEGRVQVEGAGLVAGDTLVDTARLQAAADGGTWTIDALELRAGEGTGLALVEPARVVWSDERRAVEGLALEGPTGRLSASGSLNGTDAAFTIDATRLDPTPFLAERFELGAALQDGALRLASKRTSAGWVHDLQASILARANGATDPVTISLAGALEPERVVVRELAVEYDSTSLLEASAELPYALGAADPYRAGPVRLIASGSVPGHESGSIPLPGGHLLGLAAPTAGAIDLGGTWDDLRGTAELTLEGLTWTDPDSDRGELLSPGRAVIRARIEEGGVIVDAADVDLPHNLTLDGTASLAIGDDVRSWLQPDFDPGDAVLDVTGTLAAPDLGFLASLNPDLQTTQGALEVTVDLDGSPRAPRGSGTLTLTGGLLKRRGAPSLTQVEGRCTYQDGLVTLEHLDAQLGAAPVGLRGTLDVAGAQPVFDLNLTGANTLLARDAGLRLRADLDLDLDGPLDALRLEGRVGLRNCRVTQSIDLLGPLQRGTSFESQQTGLRIEPFRDGPLADLRFNVEVDTLEPIDLRGNLMRGGARASLYLRGTGRSVHPDGALTLQTTRVLLPGGTLTFTGGSVRFDEASPLYPTLDLYGEARLIGYEVNCRVLGTTADPVIELTSSPPLGQEELLILLLTGRLPSAATGQQAAEALTVYVARDALRRMFSDGLDEDDESWVDRFEYESGREISEQGVVSLEARYRMADDLTTDRDALYIVAERDRFEDFNLGLRLTLRQR